MTSDKKRSFDPNGLSELSLWRGIGLFLAGLVILSLLAEIIGHTKLRSYLPPPSTGADSFIFDRKVAYLEEHIQQNGKLDCLLIGDSMVNNGLDPVLIETRYREITGASLHCFNMGIPALTLDATGFVANGLVQRFSPRLLIVLLSPRDFVPKYGALYRHLSTSNWVTYNTGHPSLKGWAVNYYYGYKYFQTLQYWLNPENRENIIETWRSTSPLGFSALNGYRTPHHEYGPQPDYDFYEATSQRGLQELISINNNGTHVLVIDAPVQKDYYMIYLENPTHYESAYATPLKNILDTKHIPFWRTTKLSADIPYEAWYDPMHMNEIGVPNFSYWLGAKLSEAYPPFFFK